MPIDTTIPAARAWNSWTDRPAEMVFLPLGVRVTPVLYSTRLRRASLAEPRRDAVRLGAHDVDGTVVDLSVEHGGTTLDLSWRKADTYAVAGAWNGRVLGEWGLRFWVSLCLSADGGETVHHDAARRAAYVKVGSRFVALVTADEPVQVTAHVDVAALAADFEANGYFHLASRGTEAPVLALRFNLEMMRRARFAAAVADDLDLAVEKARAALARGEPAPAPVLHVGRHAGALDAVRDVIAWNTIYDADNHRAYTAVSRIWNLGRFAVWFNDTTYAAMMAGLFDGGLCAENFATALAGATPQGNVACIVTSNDAWVDRTQAPNGALMLWLSYLRRRDRSLLEAGYGPLARNQRWWRAHRDPDGIGLVSCGTSDVGEGLYKGTHFGARNETGMDNSPTHDEAVYDPRTRTLSLIDVGLNCTLALDAEMLALAAAELGRDDEAAEFAALAGDSRARIADELWDEERGLFANRHRGGGFVRSVGPTSLYSLICGAATETQARRLLAALDDPALFGGPFGLPNVARADPAYADNVYWRGRIWPNVNWFVWLGLRRYNFFAEASALAEKSLSLFMRSWESERMCGENYGAETGALTDQPDTDRFCTWGAMLPLTAVGEILDVDPWRGLEIVATGEPVTLGPLASPLGPVRLEAADGRLVLTRGRAVLLDTDFRGRMSRIEIEPGRIALTLAAAEPGRPARFAFPAVDPAQVVAARFAGTAVAVGPGERGGIALDVTPGAAAADLVLHLDRAG
ncbi:MGH1-like glycoside hydrolase domain-containing protein [Oharaeibacter diazotrophicus]|uniref:Putative isomerase n=2 Tax=Oharaeibacter diazotrophicus TaxID=1920512 RepID=A0A4R6R6J4_9HYPH|nr:trehalase family glycosidase [Oharaeibacter diazotrophicus]TDP81157.1 putative isomerase [Oharaeibacter diazotrophicus]BBE74849.1 glucosidase YgjK precursor [Pleomorphomonas sp. SM30]GLS75647.1 hypothetical protein GCM10007904_09820 [Oharaeibacter diazotrophicus]